MFMIPMSTPSVVNASLARKSLSCSNLLAMSADITIQLAGPRRVVRWMMFATSRVLYMRAMFRSVKLTDAPAAVAKLWSARMAAAMMRSLMISRSISATISSAMRSVRVLSASMLWTLLRSWAASSDQEVLSLRVVAATESLSMESVTSGWKGLLSRSYS